MTLLDKSQRSHLQQIFAEYEKEEMTIVSSLNVNDRVLIVDGLNAFIRCFVATPTMNDDGEHIGGLTGFLKSLALAIRTLKPSRCIVVFDGKGGSQRRRKLYPEYKGNRKMMQRLNRTYDFKNKDEEVNSMRKQLVRVVEILESLPMLVYAVDNVEADDVIAYLTTVVREKQEGSQSIIMSTDKDFLQLVSEDVKVWNPIKKRLYEPETVLEEYKIHPTNFLIYRALDGDNSDNINGIKGVGLTSLVKYYPTLAQPARVTLDEIFDIAKAGKAKIYEKILAGEKILKRNIQLMRLEEMDMSGLLKLKVLERFDEEVPTINKFALTKILQEDKLSTGFPKYEEWLQMSFGQLNRFALSTHK